MNLGDRVVVIKGPYTGRAGTVTAVYVERDGLEHHLELKKDEVRVGLDGGSGQALAEAPVAGIVINIPMVDLKSAP